MKAKVQGEPAENQRWKGSAAGYVSTEFFEHKTSGKNSCLGSSLPGKWHFSSRSEANPPECKRLLVVTSRGVTPRALETNNWKQRIIPAVKSDIPIYSPFPGCLGHIFRSPGRVYTVAGSYSEAPNFFTPDTSRFSPWTQAEPPPRKGWPAEFGPDEVAGKAVH